MVWLDYAEWPGGDYTIARRSPRMVRSWAGPVSPSRARAARVVRQHIGTAACHPAFSPMPYRTPVGSMLGARMS